MLLLYPIPPVSEHNYMNRVGFAFRSRNPYAGAATEPVALRI